MTRFGDRLFVFGGQLDYKFYNDLLSFDLSSLTTLSEDSDKGFRWTIHSEVTVLPLPQDISHTQPGARTGHTAVAWKEKLYM
jgi:hypothetical protein